MSDKTWAEIDHQLGLALSEEIEATIGEPVTAIEHIGAVRVMLENGTTQTVLVASDGLEDYAVLGLTDWLHIEVRENR